MFPTPSSFITSSPTRKRATVLRPRSLVTMSVTASRSAKSATRQCRRRNRGQKSAAKDDKEEVSEAAAATEQRGRNEEANDTESSDGGSDSSSGGDSSDSETEEAATISAAEVRHAVALASEAAAATFGWNTQTGGGSNGKGNGGKGGGAGMGNALSDVIPGYTAPLRLEMSTASSSSTMTTMSGDLAKMRRNAERVDASTTVSGRGRAKARAAAMLGRVGDVKTSALAAAPSAYKNGARRRPDKTAGSRWFGFAPDRLTDELKTDLALIGNRSYLNPKKFYKKSDKIDGRMVQVGTVVEGAGEFFSSRLSNKERKANFAEEIMADGDVAHYAKKQYSKMQNANEAKRRGGYGGRKSRDERGTSKRRKMG